MFQTNGKKLYTCFIDFKEAFDSVWHKSVLLTKSKDINGKFVRLMQNIYPKTKCSLNINQRMTDYFNCEKGVLHGNPLSPLFFDLYINAIFYNINNPNPVTLDNEYNFYSLMFADDQILFTTTKEGQQNCLDFSDKCKHEINYSKTKCMTFTKGQQKEKYTFFINTQIIETVNDKKNCSILTNTISLKL